MLVSLSIVSPGFVWAALLCGWRGQKPQGFSPLCTSKLFTNDSLLHRQSFFFAQCLKGRVGIFVTIESSLVLTFFQHNYEIHTMYAHT